jgi:hypothetical protein
VNHQASSVARGFFSRLLEHDPEKCEAVRQTRSVCCCGGVTALFPSITVDYFGGRNASGIIGLLYTGAAFGSFMGPKFAGDVFDRSGSYMLPLAVSAACACIAAVLVLAAPSRP